MCRAFPRTPLALTPRRNYARPSKRWVFARFTEIHGATPNPLSARQQTNHHQPHEANDCILASKQSTKAESHSRSLSTRSGRTQWCYVAWCYHQQSQRKRCTTPQDEARGSPQPPAFATTGRHACSSGVWPYGRGTRGDLEPEVVDRQHMAP